MEPNASTTAPFGSRLLARAAIPLILVGLTAVVAAIVVSGRNGAVDPAQPIENPPATSLTTETVETTSSIETPPTTEFVPSRGAEGSAGAIAVGPFTPQDVQDAGWEGIGCWLHPNAELGSEVHFFMGWDGGFVVIDGESVEMANTGGRSFGNTDDVFAGGGYRAEFVEVGDPRPSSIESTVQDVVLRITADDGRRTDISGVLWCGV